MADLITEDLRLLVLRCLDEIKPGRRANSSIVFKMVKAKGHPALREVFDDAVQWLKDQRRLLEVEEVPETRGLLMLTLLAAGQEVAQGERAWSGIAEPSLRHD